MGAGSDQDDFDRGDFIDQEPVWLDVALPNTLPLTGQFVWPISDGKFAVLCEQLDDGNQIFDVSFPRRF